MPIYQPPKQWNWSGKLKKKAFLCQLRCAHRDNREVAQRLKALEMAARGSENTMPYLVEAAKAYATLGEMMDVFREVFGEYHPSWGY